MVKLVEGAVKVPFVMVKVPSMVVVAVVKLQPPDTPSKVRLSMFPVPEVISKPESVAVKVVVCPDVLEKVPEFT